MKVKTRFECSFDFAINHNQREYMISIDLSKWRFGGTDETATGYKSWRFLCLTFSTLDRAKFDKWLGDSIVSLLSPDNGIGLTPSTSEVRQDLM